MTGNYTKANQNSDSSILFTDDSVSITDSEASESANSHISVAILINAS